jgi:CheY-like chemotaxis protein
VSTPHILVIEDDSSLRDLWVDGLGEAGYTVIGVEDGAAALARLPHFHPNLILLDLVMPGAEMDGIAFLSELGRVGAPGEVPIVIVSGLGEAVSDALTPPLAQTLRISSVLPKPVDLGTLLREVRRLVGPG